MTYNQAIAHFGGAANLAEQLGITNAAVYRWGYSGRIAAKKIPWQWQCTITYITHGKLHPTLGPWEKS